MEAQEAVMQERFVKVANAMTEVINNTARKVKSYQREKLKVYYEYVPHSVSLPACFVWFSPVN